MPRSNKNAIGASGKASSAKANRAAKALPEVAGVTEFTTVPEPPAKDAAEITYPPYEYPGYDTDPDFDFPNQEEEEWPGPDPEPPLDWDLPDYNDTDWEEPAAAVEPGQPAPSPSSTPAQGSVHSLLDYFAAHALNGLLAGTLAVPNTSLNAAQTARLAYDCAEAMLRERQGRVASQSLLPNAAGKEAIF